MRNLKKMRSILESNYREMWLQKYVPEGKLSIDGAIDTHKISHINEMPIPLSVPFFHSSPTDFQKV